ncbi:MAG: LamG domain-containing protein [Planctomycetaceae bacterium]|nr:LamG domain-containing protein [Planctomycetaceae bacterium]
MKVVITWLVLSLAMILSSDLVAAAKPGLLGHWKLSGTTDDDSGHKRHAANHGADLKAAGPDGEPVTAAAFDGRNQLLEVPADKAPRLGRGDFSISVRLHTAAELDDLPGDILSQYDPAGRRGFSLGITNNAGVTTNQANYRNIHFGIDNDRLEPQWTDHGRPGKALLIFSLAVYKGELFAGTCEPGAGEAGHVYRLAADGNTDAKWIDCGSPHPSNSVSALAVFDRALYAGVSKYRVAGSSLPESENQNLGGKVFRYDGDGRWIDCGRLPGAEAIGGLVVYRGKLYATSLYKPAGFYRYEGGQNWTSLDVPDGKRVEALGVYNGQLFATSYDHGHVYRYDGRSWTDCGQVGDEKNTQTYSFAVHFGKLYVGTWATGKVFRYQGDNDWADVGRLGEELEVMGMIVHNGQLFAGTLPLAEVYRFDGREHWHKVGWLDQTPDVKYRRAWTMAEYRGRLFCGTLPEGKVWSIQAGCSVTYDDELQPGWRHLAAVRQKDRLKLYIDGKLVATSAAFAPEQFDLTCDQPLKIGFGPHDYFQGRLSDLRLYGQALSAEEIARLAGR